MKKQAKRKTGKGIKIRGKKRTNRKTGKGMKSKKVPVSQIFKKAMKNVRSKIKNKKGLAIKDAARKAVAAAQKITKNHKIPRKAIHNELPRIIPVPKSGGALPLLPIFAGLSALGALLGGSAGVANAVNSASKATKDFKEAKRHNQTMEAIAIGKPNAKTGAGLFLKPFKSGLSLYLTPYSKNE